MTDTKDTLYGVGCDAKNCKYHGHENECCASHISVGSQSAVNKVETFCGTFAPKSCAK